MSLGTILLIVLVLILVGVIPTWAHSCEPPSGLRSTTAADPAFVTKRARSTVTPSSDSTGTAEETSASALPVTPPPQAFYRGWLASNSITRARPAANWRAAHYPAGPAPTTAMSASLADHCTLEASRLQVYSSEVPHPL